MGIHQGRLEWSSTCRMSGCSLVMCLLQLVRMMLCIGTTWCIELELLSLCLASSKMTVVGDGGRHCLTIDGISMAMYKMRSLRRWVQWMNCFTIWSLMHILLVGLIHGLNLHPTTTRLQSISRMWVALELQGLRMDACVQQGQWLVSHVVLAMSLLISRQACLMSTWLVRLETGRM